MPFDSFMTSALAYELSEKLVGLKVDKVTQPERDEIDLLFHIGKRNRLVINCTASTPYMALSDVTRENPMTPPMMSMLLRKHLSRAKITSICQLGFDRIIKITFDSGDELGYRKSKYLYCEMMGRGSNLIFSDENGKILAAFRQNDITTKFDRIVMVGLPYEPMPPQDKLDTMLCTKEDFFNAFESVSKDGRIDLLLQKMFSGFGKLTAREISYLSCGDPEGKISDTNIEKIWNSFCHVRDIVENKAFFPCLIYESKEAFLSSDNPIDFSFMRICQFGSDFYVHPCESVSAAIENYYLLRNQKERHRQHFNDIAQILKNCKNRLEKKIAVQLQQLQDAEDAEEKRLFGDLIMQEMYRISRGDSSVTAMDYSNNCNVTIPLDPQLSPSQNAQKYYREYGKKKTAQIKVEEQIKIAHGEIDYVDSVIASLEHAVTSADLEEIRQELSHWSYGRRLTAGLKKPQKRQAKAKPKLFKTSTGRSVYIGMNNYQNDVVSTQLAEKDDYWFHIKNYHGSHVLLKAMGDPDFSDEDILEAASFAAYYSEVQNSDRVEVDYARGRYVKKPNGSKPGFVTYKNHFSVIVTPAKPK
jgi:predicted ribosome quality control (RQC) complex YloA/Tae2 family protein